MQFQTRWILIAILMLLTGAATWAEISTDYDHSINFATYKTYSWGKLETANSLWDQRVKAVVDTQLAAKGWTQVPSGGNAIVNAFGKTHAEQTLSTFYNGFPGRRWGGFGETTTTVNTYKVGTLVVDLFDATSRNLIWRGVASDTLSSSPDKNTKKLYRTQNV